MLALTCVAWGQEMVSEVPSGALILDFDLKVTLGERTVHARPKVAVGNGKEATIEIMSDEESGEYLRISVVPRLAKDGKVELEMDVKTRLKDREVARKMKVATLLGSRAAYALSDPDRGEEFDFVVTPTLAP